MAEFCRKCFGMGVVNKNGKNIPCPENCNASAGKAEELVESQRRYEAEQAEEAAKPRGLAQEAPGGAWRYENE